MFLRDLALVSERIIKSIAKFCCTDRKEVKSEYCWDSTFDIGESSSYYLLALSFRDGTLSNNTAKCFPVMLSHKI